MINTVLSLNRGYTISCPLETQPNITAANKMTLPVSASSYAYSQFKHVSGVPVPAEADDIRGVTITRLKIIDVLIEQLGSGKNGTLSLTEEQIDRLVEQVKAIQSVPYTAEKDVAGALFDVVS